ncbi:MAG: sialidase family protein, partial [Verrucomicrobiota bacterium]|nr:sialidase family protein [Verrucomicrobiota bacterium]
MAGLTGLPQALQAQDFSGVPGEVLDYVALQYDLFITPPRRFVADPEIAVLPNGDYVAAWAMSGWASTADTAGVTTLYRSSDKGATWTSLGTQTPFLRGSLFVHDGALYFLGGNYEGGDGIIKKSLDNGSTWSTTTLTISSPATPNTPVQFNNRWWSAVSTSSHSASDTSDLMQAASWMQGGGYASQASWPSEGEFMGEGQIVASPEQGVVLLPKVKQHALTAISQVDPTTGAVSIDPNHNFVDLPGGEKKFGAAYDAVSGKFYILSNPVLSADSGATPEPDMIRNTAAMLSSEDLYNWKMEKIFLYSSDVEREGFGYFNFDFDGTNMAVIARTAFKVPGETYPKSGRGGHDTNVLTFHTIADFRNATPDQVLKLEGGDVVRYEKTQYQDAPLGTFALGSNFSGADLTDPNGFGKAVNGDVYIREAGGRILRFDTGGNFIETTNASPVSFQTSELSVDQLADGSIWTKSGSGNWSGIDNWYYWNRADTTEEIAVFGSASTVPATITLDSESHETLFNTDADFEGWTTVNLSGTTVAGGMLSGTPSSTDPQIYRTDLSFFGGTAPNITIRMRTATNNVPLNLYWGTSSANGFSATRKLVATYTGNGEFQDVVFPTAGQVEWEGQVIRRIRIDPLNGPLVALDVDSITLKEERTRIKGLQFRNTNAYTLSGAGSL